MFNVEEFPGQINQLENYIQILEKERTDLSHRISELNDRIHELEAQVFGGNTK